MKNVSVKQMKALDAEAIKQFGIPALVLMENAGRSAAEVALTMLPKKGFRRVTVLCGYGNNGGDGFVCSRHLLNQGVQVGIYLVGEKKAFSEETRINHRILINMHQRFRTARSVRSLAKLEEETGKSHLVIDAIFGIGLRGELNGFYQGLFARLDAVQTPVLALDVPSGLDADTGRPQGAAIRADKTVSFGRLKKGLAKKEARYFAGDVVIGDISLPRTPWHKGV